METISAPTIELLLVDDHAMFRQGLARVLEKEAGFRLAGQYGSAAEALASLERHRAAAALDPSANSADSAAPGGVGPSRVVARGSEDADAANLILLDVDLGPERALDFVAEAKRKGFDGRILVVTAGISGQEAIQLVQAGVAGIIHKHHSTEELCSTIRQVAAGEIYLEKEYFDALYRSVDRSKTSSQPRLTDRDKIVLRLIFQGLSNREIAERLHISESGVKSSLRQLFDKLGVRTRAQLVKVALEQYRDQL